MAEPFIAEIRMFPFTFAPRGWAFCSGQIMAIQQNTALFSLLGVTYGGDGKVTFALPNLQGSTPIQQGQGPGLSNYVLGEESGVSNVTLLQSEIPQHTHVLQGSAETGEGTVPGPDNAMASPSANFAYGQGPTALAPMAPQTLSLAGGNQAHNNMQPYLTVNFCIALQGIFPSRP